MANYAGSYFYVYYEATLKSAAVNNATGNKNSVKLEYSNKIKPESESGDDDGDDDKNVITDETIVYTFKIVVNKVGKSGTEEKALEGVTFDLYRVDSEGDIKSDAVNGLPEDTKFVKVKSGLTTEASGQINVNGLENGTYYLVETKTNDGYNLLKAPVEVKISVSYATETKTTTVTDTNGKTTTTRTVKTTTFEDENENDNKTGIYTQKVINSKGFTLPTTGGIGTYIFFIVGISMMAAAVLLFVRSKKKEEKNQ